MLIHWLWLAPTYQPPYRTESVHRGKARGEREGEGRRQGRRQEVEMNRKGRGRGGRGGREREGDTREEGSRERRYRITPTKQNTTLSIASPQKQTLKSVNKQTNIAQLTPQGYSPTITSM